MKIAYLANVRIPSERAHATQIIHMCKAFTEAGHDLDLYCNTRVQKNKKDIATHYNIDVHFNLYRLPYGVFNPNIKITFYISEIIFSLGFLFKKKSVYDVIYSRNEWIVWFLSYFISHKKLTWESHEAKRNFPARQILRRNVNIIAISEGVRDEYGERVPSVLVAHDGVDESFYRTTKTKSEARKALGIPIERKIAMYIGGFDSWKGVETFCEAAEASDDVTFVIIGGSNQLPEYKDKYPEVIFLGSRPYAELPDNQQAADVLVIPNTAKSKLSALYTSPLKLFAHLTAGIPLVVSDIPSITVVTGQEDVAIFEPDNAASLLESIEIVFNDYEYFVNKAKALQVTSKKYLWKVRAKNIINFISTRR